MALRPLAHPKVGTYWRTTTPYDHMRPDAPSLVAVVHTQRGYAKFGMQECFVEFAEGFRVATGLPYALVKHRLDLDTFLRCFTQMSDEELGDELGMEILGHYDD